MRYKRITLELIVVADEAEEVLADLNLALVGLDEKHTLFGGEIETATFEHSGKARKSALAHTLAAGETATKAARKGLAVALRAVV